MNLQDLKTKLKNIIEISKDFIINYKRYFLAGGIFIVMALVLFLGTSSSGGDSKSTSGVYKSFKKNNNSELTTLINNYYTAYAEGDTDTLTTLATPVSDQEISYIAFYSQYIESFNDIQIYTKPGLTDNSYLVTTEVELKYNDIDTAAPGLDFFYVETNEDGKLYINNIYGSFNQNNNIYEMDTEISDLIAVYIRQQDLLDLKAEVDEAYESALESDENLSALMSDTLPAAIIQWNTDYNAEVAAAAEEATKAEEEAAAAAEAEEQAAAEAEEEANSYTGTTNAKANVRSAADASSDKLGSLESGTEITIYGEEGDFYQFDYNGTKAYITKDAVNVGDSTEEESTEDTEEEETTTAAALTAGDTITLTSTVNIRSAMDSSASKVAVAYSGEEVEVVMSYAEGWTKVKYGNKEGYIRTDLLQE
ncbi:MAG: SH3 domain-containing protein [Pseudobutyrivibrio ruminis]|uniref:SH3 domain-containing protein n=1 Tax=Pseudobutyrivibrio ruminis TaxID=46206 RepID=UPI0026EE7103|nr:SH3 domain-containing protein [Pseudobutyrivibrio ruminis]MBE5912712.1 SH3 domain-containing protein [Pseudobutyrivibrio ruminis]